MWKQENDQNLPLLHDNIHNNNILLKKNNICFSFQLIIKYFFVTITIIITIILLLFYSIILNEHELNSCLTNEKIIFNTLNRTFINTKLTDNTINLFNNNSQLIEQISLSFGNNINEYIVNFNSWINITNSVNEKSNGVVEYCLDKEFCDNPILIVKSACKCLLPKIYYHIPVIFNTSHQGKKIFYRLGVADNKTISNLLNSQNIESSLYNSINDIVISIYNFINVINFFSFNAQNNNMYKPFIWSNWMNFIPIKHNELNLKFGKITLLFFINNLGTFLL